MNHKKVMWCTKTALQIRFIFKIKGNWKQNDDEDREKDTFLELPCRHEGDEKKAMPSTKKYFDDLLKRQDIHLPRHDTAHHLFP